MAENEDNDGNGTITITEIAAMAQTLQIWLSEV